MCFQSIDVGPERTCMPKMSAKVPAYPFTDLSIITIYGMTLSYTRLLGYIIIFHAGFNS